MSTLPYPKSLEGLSEWDSKLNEAKTNGYFHFRHISANRRRPVRELP